MKYVDIDKVIVGLIVYILIIGAGMFLFIVGVLPTYKNSFSEKVMTTKKRYIKPLLVLFWK